MPSHPIDWDQFLHRPTPSSLEAVAQRHRAAIHGKRVLVTGAAGSIGSALARTIALAEADELVLLDTSEPELSRLAHQLAATATPASITNPEALAAIFCSHGPEIVFHAAALKHVPLGETTPFAVVETNALGTANLVTASHAAEHLVMVSTDKAADPLSLMGASKRIAEQALLAAPKKFRTTAVRLGNVLSSSGSVVPLFLDQIASGGPLTVTDAAARRFFMTTAEAVEALLAALSATDLVAADPGPSIRILDLAQHLIAHSERPETEIAYTTLRPGDKLEESLLSARETFTEATNGPLRKIESRIPEPAAIEAAMHQLKNAIAHRDLPQLIETVQSLVPEYRPSQLLREQLAAQAVSA